MEQYVDGMVLGVGFDTAAQNIHFPALEGVELLPDIAGMGGQSVLFSLEQLSNSTSLSKQLNISATASLKYASIGSGSMSAQFINNIKQNSFSIYVVVRTIVTNAERLLDLSRVRLKESAAHLFSQPDHFIQQYGDSFVYGVVTGGEFFGVLEIETASAEEYREIKAKLSGKGQYGLFSGNASASFSESFSTITSSFEMRSTILRQGGTGALMENVTPEHLRVAALSFPEEVAGTNGYPYGALLIPYNHIEHPVAEPLSVAHRADAIERLGRLRESCIRVQNDLEFASTHPYQFPGIDLSMVNDRYNQLSDQIEIIVNAARQFFSDSTFTDFPHVNLALLDNILPPQIGGPMEERIRELERQVEQLQRLEAEVARLRQQAEHAHSRIDSVDAKAQNALNHGVGASHAVNNIHAKTRDTHAFNELQSYLRSVTGGNDLGFGDH